MRHAIAGNRLGRNSSLRKATVRDIARATLIQQRVLTTKAKAKEARKVVERLISLGKDGTLAGKRKAYSILSDHQLVSDLFNKTAPLFKNRMGGYTRVIPVSTRRLGDNARLAYLELTEKTETIISGAKTLQNKKDKKDKKAIKPQLPQDSAQAAPTPSDKEEHRPTAPLTPTSPKTQTQEPPRQQKTKPPSRWSGIKNMFRRKIGE